MAARVAGRLLSQGYGEGTVLATDKPLSFWGGLDPATGDVIDRHHPLNGANVAGRVLVMPSGRGSSSASGVLLESLVAGFAPAGIILAVIDEIIALGAIVADEVLDIRLPIVVLDQADYQVARDAIVARIHPTGVVELDVDR